MSFSRSARISSASKYVIESFCRGVEVHVMDHHHIGFDLGYAIRPIGMLPQMSVDPMHLIPPIRASGEDVSPSRSHFRILSQMPFQRRETRSVVVGTPQIRTFL
jgi:hypothetical protein